MRIHDAGHPLVRSTCGPLSPVHRAHQLPTLSMNATMNQRPIPVVNATPKCPQFGFLHARSRGRMIPAFIHPDATSWLQSTYDTGPQDILICTHQKVGTHLTKKYVVETLCAAGALGDTHPAGDGDIGKAAVPWPEVMVSQSGVSAFAAFLERTKGQPRIFYTHANADELPVRSLHPDTKVIMTYRDPKGAAVSQFHFYKNHPTLGVSPDLTMASFVDFFLEGDLYFGDYHDHVTGHVNTSAWGMRPEQHLILRFEDLVERKMRSVRTLSRFLLGRLLPADVTRNVACSTDFNTMKQSIQQNPGSFHFNPDRFFRSGKTDDWADHLSPADAARIDAKTALKWGDLTAPIPSTASSNPPQSHAA